MLIRFNKELPTCAWEHPTPTGGLIRIEFKSIDQADIMAWSRSRDGFKIPDHCWITEIVDGQVIRKMDRERLNQDDLKEMYSDDWRLGASKIASVSGIEQEVEDGTNQPLDISTMNQRDLASLLELIANEYPEFGVWFTLYLQGSKKKSGKMEIC